MSGRRAKILRKQALVVWQAGKETIQQACAYNYRRFWHQYKAQYKKMMRDGTLPKVVVA